MELESTTSERTVGNVAAASAAAVSAPGAASKGESAGTQKLNKVFKSDFDAKYNIVDINTPLNAYMSGQYKRSYAYYNLRNVLPVVLTNVIDTLTKDKNELVARYGESAREELKIIIGLISRLKYELQTDKPFQQYNGEEADREIWNHFITHLPDDERSFYRACWLYSECYTYRKLYSFVENSIFIKEFDYFAKVKEHALTSCIEDILSLSNTTRRTEKSKEVFEELMKINLWSNRCDVLASAAYQNERIFNSTVLDDVSAIDSFILINNVSEIWKLLDSKPHKKQQVVDIVLDNAGYELFTDFILAEYMIEKGLATKVRFHVKAHPWFVLDTTEADFKWTLQYLSEHSDYIISLIGKKYLQFLDEGKFELAPVSCFWTSPHPFFAMRDIAPELYQKLQESRLIIFKGDLNGRKILSDVCWDTTQDIKTCLRGFLPTNFCLIRTIKAEVLCGLPKGLNESLTQRDPQWMLTGNYGIIHFVDGTREFGY
ncbi:damage-control phosphatase ARMT1 isoform X2 [Scaptodrosophila lebanonensis]|uniref:Sugar phosphate phosphatase n=1 Tax=Drosophila lebanonensis TaxID=7225 RepID=A0A6J2TJ13_DROLE|nr:damage-control phosphatase ARMT1 isoform X2 [Scaptodrosophila lebanonensis]